MDDTIDQRAAPETPSQLSTGLAAVVLIGLVSSAVIWNQNGKRDKEDRLIREFYQNMRVDTVHHADGSLDRDKTTVRLNLQHAEELRKKVQPE
jgi:hypothetical protein